MKANELRIGNWFIEYEEPQQFDGDFYHLSDIKPIPLTREWLLKFGFTQINNRFTLENFRFHIEKPCNYHGFLFCENHIVITDKIKHVHQLQNLYFALTGEELTIKQ